MNKDILNKKGLILLANGFEDTEAITTIDILYRAGIKPLMVSMNDEVILTQCKNELVVKESVKNIKFTDFDFLVIPGGGAVMNNLIKNETVDEAIHSFMSERKLVAAICAGPMTIGKLGYLKNRKFTCFPSCEVGIDGIYTKSGVEVDGNIITGKSMAYTIPFALEIVKYVLGEEKAKQVENNIYAK